VAYLYVHVRLDKDEVFYVGISRDSNGDYSRAFENSKWSRNVIWHRIVAKTDYSVHVIVDNLDWETAKTLETVFIKAFGRKDLKTGTLCNMTDGGEGMFNPSDETREKLRVRMIGNSLALGMTHSEETKVKMREAAAKLDKFVYTNPERCKKISDAKKGIPKSEETKKKLSDNLIGKSFVDRFGEARAAEIGRKISETNTGKKKSNQSKAMKGRFTGELNPMFGKKQSEEFKEQKRKMFLENNPGKNKSEETRKKISMAHKGKPSKQKGIKRKIVRCPHCDKEGGDGMMQRWHFDNCKLKGANESE
jgi:hypothetical protein